MDDVMDFFDFSKDCKRKKAPHGVITGNKHALVTETHDSKPLKREFVGTEYVNKIIEKEKLLMAKMDEKNACSSKTGNYFEDMDAMESDDEDFSDNSPKIRAETAYYEKFRFDLKRSEDLPIYAHREDIINAIDNNPVVIIKGDTGCGKTTQVPQYILDEACKRREYCNIVVTQPRRIAAITISNRVCEERKWEPGTVCAYQVGLHQQCNMEDTRLTYCTTGVLLNKIINHKTLTHYTHIILDEVHERTEEMDFLLIVVRRFLSLNSRHVKIILMSATIDEREFANYFATKHLPPVISASHGRRFPLVKFYRDQLRSIRFTDDEQQDEPGISPEGYAAAIKILMVMDNMERISAEQTEGSYEEGLRTGAVLIFLPGLYEIDTMADKISEVANVNNDVRIYVVRIHSLLSPDAQQRAFRPPPAGFRKVILATNIAESSITVPDITYVIDFCLTKVHMVDSASNFTTLKMVWASKANCRQRAGRVGRLRSGRVYRMVSKRFYQQYMSEFGIPELLRKPLHQAVLRTKLLDLDTPMNILALAMTPPNLSDIKNSILLLKEVGALYTTVDGVYDECDGDLTYWGHVMAKLPLDVHLSRLILLGYMFNCLEETQIIAAGLQMTVRSLYTYESSCRSFRSLWMHQIWADGSGSDLFAMIRVYRTYRTICLQKSVRNSAEQWARRFLLNLRSLKEMHLMVEDLQKRCEILNLKPFASREQCWGDHELCPILKIVIAGAFYPNYFMYENRHSADRERNIYQTISGLDPKRTVYFTNYKTKYMGDLYSRRIKELFEVASIPPEKIKVTFQDGAGKVFVTFKSEDENGTEYVNEENVFGSAVPEVQKAIYMRKERFYHKIQVMDYLNSLNYVRENGVGDVIDGVWVPPRNSVDIKLYTLPSVYDKTIKGHITHILNCSKFYFQPHVVAECVDNMTEVFNSKIQLKCSINNAASITKGLQLLAWRRTKFQRARVLSVENDKGKPMFRVRFIDYGDIIILPADLLRLMKPELMAEYENLPPRMFECRLAMVQPTTVGSHSNRWTDEANDMLKSLSSCGRVELEIYSLVDGIASVIIHTREGRLNEKLVERNLAQRIDEDFMSRKDRDFRLRKQQGDKHLPTTERLAINEEYLRYNKQPEELNLEPPPLSMCTSSIHLKGPYSTLETSIYSLMRVGAWKTSSIENNSVNAVLLDNNPTFHSNQLVVSASICEFDNSRMLTARATTLMPNIHGFGALMVLLFCPTVQIKCNKERTKFVSLLAGLGYDPDTKESYYAEHDVALDLDVDINKDDIRLVNQIRYNIDTMFTNIIEKNSPVPSYEDSVFIFKQTRKLLRRLLTKDRSFIEPFISNNQYCWEDLPFMEEVAEPYGSRCMFSLHTTQELTNENMSTIMALTANNKELHSLRNFGGTMQSTSCKLCNQNLESVTELRLHLLTQLHLDRERQIGWRSSEMS